LGAIARHTAEQGARDSSAARGSKLTLTALAGAASRKREIMLERDG
jgi:hypothetical protein